MTYFRLKHETRLTTLETEVAGVRLRVERLRDALLDLLDPIPAVEELDRGLIMTMTVSFVDAHLGLVEKLAVIKKIKEALGS